jgi:hypothetical protein
MLNNLPSDFDVNTYKKYNLDLMHMTDEEAIIHYKNHGYNENRKYKDIIIDKDFDVSMYKRFNIDLVDMTDEEAIIHYKNHGINEKRKYKVEKYINNINQSSLYYFINNNKNIVGIYSPYEYSLGGGENYLSNIMNFFINKNYLIIFFNSTDNNKVKLVLSYYLNNNEKYVLQVSNDILFDNKFINKIQGKLDYFVYMSNISIPEIKGIANKNIYHCQFPFDYNHYDNKITYLLKEKTIYTYDKIIVNSEFTYKYLLDTYNKYNIKYDVNNIKILYPICVNKINTCKFLKYDKSFVMIGRIFDYVPNANNKHFDKIIKIMNMYKKFNYELNIIGSVKSKVWYKYLINLIGNNTKIRIHSDISEDNKNDILKYCKYIIQLTGIEENKVSNEEHFGISILEGINYNCIPITYNGGFPPYYIKNKKNGYIVNNLKELETLIYNILNNIEIIDYNTFNNSDFILNKCTTESFIQSLEETI